MVVTLWDGRAFQFQESLLASEGAAMFVVITGLVAKKFSGTNDNIILFMHVLHS